jgi:hypothetical protein
MSATIGEQFARALAARDPEAMREVLAPEIDFRGMTPGKFWESASRDDLVQRILFDRWMDAAVLVDTVEITGTGAVGNRSRIGYRFRGTRPAGPFDVEQQAFYTEQDGRITWLRIMCSGFQAPS